MKSSKYVLETESTIANSRSQIMSIQSTIPSKHLSRTNQSKLRYDSRMLSIDNRSSQTKISNNDFFNENMIQTEIKIGNQGFKSKISVNQRVAEIFKKIVYKKPRYCFQILKQFILFPDDTQSSIASISVHDPLIFTDEVLHTLLKILETKFLENKLWAFLNLRMMPYYKAATKFQTQISKIHRKTIKTHKKVSFDLIKRASEDIFSSIIPKTLKLISSVGEQRQSSNHLSSRIVSERICPSVQARPSDSGVTPIKTQSNSSEGRSDYSYIHSRLTRVYTPSEYEEELKRRSASRTVFQPSSPRSQVITSEKYQAKQNTHQKVKVVHYYEKSYQNSNLSQNPQILINICNQPCTSVCQANSRCQTISCCQSHSCSPCCQSYSYNLHGQKHFSLNETTYSQKNISRKINVDSKNSRQTQESDNLKELDKRIKYLQFLKALAAQQENQ